MHRYINKHPHIYINKHTHTHQCTHTHTHTYIYTVTSSENSLGAGKTRSSTYKPLKSLVYSPEILSQEKK